MGFLSKVFASTATTTAEMSATTIQEQTAAFRSWLNGGGNPVIRMWVEETSNLGNQSSTINLLYRLVRPTTSQNLTYGYAGVIEVYYQQDPLTKEKIWKLLPELSGKTEGEIDDAKIKLIHWTEQPENEVAFGLTGAADDAQAERGGLAKMLNVGAFLRLQPYFWRPESKNEQIIFKTGETIGLNEQAALGGDAFARRLYFVDPSLYEAPQFNLYPGEIPLIIKHLTSEEFLSEHALQAIYSFKDSLIYFNSSGIFAIALACGAALRWQKSPTKPYSRAKPVVIVNFDTVENEASLDSVRQILQGGPTLKETGMAKLLESDQTLRQNVTRRQNYFKTLQVEPDARFYTLYRPTTLQAVKDAVRDVTGHNDRVLFIQLGNAPQPLFNHALYRSTLVPVFEGQNTTNAAINMGRAYMQIPRENASTEQRAALYPSVTLQVLNPDDVPQALVKLASQYNTSAEVWPESDAQAPCTQLGEYLQQYTSEKPTDTIHKYFAALRDRYAAADQDKFNLGLAFLNTKLPSEQRLARALADDNPLNALYKELEGKVEIGKPLNLIPGVLTSGFIKDYFLKLLEPYAPALTLTVARFTHEGEPGAITKITLSGTTRVFESIGVQNQIDVVFTAPDKLLTSDVSFTAVGPWGMPGVPWIVLRDSFLTLRVPQGKLPVAATMGGYYPPMESLQPPIVAKFAIPIFSAAPVWPASIVFEKIFPSIATAFQMATSVNLVSLLPPPLSAISDFGLERVETAYDFEKQRLGSLLIAGRSNTRGVPLVGKISLDNARLMALIVDPAGQRAISVTGAAEFLIGTALVSVSVSYPNPVFQGSLVSGEIKLTDLLTLFLPGVQLNPPSQPTISGFSFSYSRPSDSLSVSMKFNINWSFSFPGKPDLFTVKDVGFSISRNRGVNAGTIEGSIILFSGAAALGLVIGADYNGASSSWTFRARQTSGVLDIATIVHTYLGENWPVPSGLPQVNGLALSISTAKDGDYQFSASTAKPWQPIPGIDVAARRVTLKVGYGDLGAVALLSSMEGLTVPTRGYYGELSGDFHLWNIDLSVFLRFKEGLEAELGLVWGALTATVVQKNNETIATFKLAKRSIGSLVEEFVSWVTGASYALSAPFNVLNSLELSNFEVVYNFTKETVALNVQIGPVDFGLFKLKGVGLQYDPKAKGTPEDPRTTITIDAAFVWRPEDKLSWDPSRPEQTPAPSGGGNKYLDLRLLALGQHVTVAGLTDERRVEGVIKKLRGLKVPQPPEIPVGGDGQPVFAPESAWFVGFDFGLLKVGDDPKQFVRRALAPGAAGEGLALPEAEPASKYFIQLSLVFNDPRLYALRIALDGPLAKIFAGLDFQIMYRQISDTVGVYSAQIALPELMRRIQAGVYTITLPTFAIDVYTNGDFQVDIGFPWNQNFARSFTIEAIVYPGIPLLGSAGFYFGKLSSATTDKVPKARDGWFNPVLVFGFGAQFGLGKSVEAGILRAGFSATVFGIIEGVLARWLPYDGSAPNTRKSDLQDGYFFSLTGTVGAIGKLYGSVDFAIIKADVNVEVKLYIQITLAAYQPIPITLRASVDISVSLTINLGLFKIRIGLSFSANLKLTFTIDNPMKDPPWHALEADEYPRRRMLQRLRSEQLKSGLLAASYEPVWSNLLPGTALPLVGYVAPVITVAGDEATTPAEQAICYAIGLFLSTPALVERPREAVRAVAGGNPGASGVAHAALARARQLRRFAGPQKLGALAADSPATFEDLAVLVAQWVIAAGQPKPMAPAQVDDVVITGDALEAMLSYLSDSQTPNPIPLGEIEKFLAAQVTVELDDPRNDASGDAVFFPAPPGMRLHVDDYAGWKGVDYTFGDYNSTSASFREDLTRYFDALRVRVQPPSVDDPAPAQRVFKAAQDTELSVGAYVFCDYFTAIARQGVQALLDGLRDFKWVIEPEKSIQDIVDWVNRTGNLTGTQHEFTAEELFEGNPEHHFVGKKVLTIRGMVTRAPGGQSFTQIAASSLFGGAFDAAALATANAGAARILTPGVEIVYPGLPPYNVQGGDSLASISALLGVSLAELLAKSNVLASAELISPLSLLVAPDFYHTTSDGETPASVAASYGLSPALLGGANLRVVGLFDTGSDPNLNIPHLVQFRVGELFGEAHRTLALQNLGGMVSRFYMGGLRLPTKGVAPKHRGLFVREPEPGNFTLPDELGLFALTGQAFQLPDVSDPAGGGEPPIFRFKLSRGEQETWLSFRKTHEPELTFELLAGPDYQRYKAVRDYARANRLDTGLRSLKPMDASAIAASRFPLPQEAPWQTAAQVVLPRQPLTPSVQRPRLWTLPSALVNLPHGGEGEPRPRMTPVIARFDQATGATRTEPVHNFGFGVLVPFKVKKVPPLVSSPTTARTYEIVGASTGDIVLLERLLDQVRSDDSAFQQMLLLYPPSATGSEVKGWESADPAHTVVGITQVNLSTETRPPSVALRAAVAPMGDGTGRVINGYTAFLRLLWEASITRQGGFFLAYHDGANDTGLPDRIFNDRGEADVAVLGLFTDDGAEGHAVANYMNVLATDEAFTLGDAAFTLETVRTGLQSRKTTTEDTVGALAALFYLDPASLLEDNPGVMLRTGGTVTVEGGLYQVPPITGAPTVEQPGGDLGLIAKHFGTTVDAIRAANPHRTAWPSPLPVYTALQLPRLDVIIGAGLSPARLDGFAAYHGVSIAAVVAAAANAERRGLLEAGQTLAVKLGPVERTAALPPGVAGLRLVRKAPDPIPLAPTGSDGQVYLQHMFSLLGYRMAPTPDFRQSPMGLPGGPGDSGGGSPPDHDDKIRAPRAAAEVTEWIYERTLPYPRFYGQEPGGNVLEDPSPYLGVGGLLQFSLQWRDVFGNLVLADLGSPTPAVGQPLDLPPQVPGYVDELLGLTQWPSTSSAYRVRPNDAKDPVLELVLDFDPGPYEPGSTLDEAERRRRIRQALQIYDRLLQQLDDPNGVSLELTASVTPGAGSLLDDEQRGALVAWVRGLRDWLKSLLEATSGAAAGALEPVHTVTVPLDLAHINEGQIFKVEVTFTIARKAGLVAGALRSGAAVGRRATSVAPSTGPLSERESVTPEYSAWRRAAMPQATSEDLRELGPFAVAFTAAFSKLGSRSLRIATGTDRAQVSNGSAQAVWAVQLGTSGDEAISYSIDNAGAPKIFAPRPVSNKLESSPAVAIYDYRTGVGIDFTTPSRTPAFNGIDLDAWMKQSLAWIDELLSPQYVTPTLVLRSKLGEDLLAPLLEAKRALAAALKKAMIAVFADESVAPAERDAIREAFYQRMLDVLGSFYVTKAGLQFKSTVHAAIGREPLAVSPPRLYGDVGLKLLSGSPPAGKAEDKNFSLSSPKLELAFADAAKAEGTPRLLSMLFATTSVTSKAVTLNLDYEGRFIEHEIGKLPGIDGYQPSSWLSFIDDFESTGGSPLRRSLGQFPVPIVLREFPPTPTLVVQTVVDGSSPATARRSAANPCDPLADVTHWTYGFTYAQEVHRQQDRIFGEIQFNLNTEQLARAMAARRTLFEDLAEMITVYPAVRKDLDGKLARLDFSTEDETLLHDAAVALGSATSLVQRLAETADAGIPALLAAARFVSGLPPYHFTVEEGEVDKTNADGSSVRALLVTIRVTDEERQAGVGQPYLDIPLPDGDLYQREKQEVPTGYGFVYRTPGTGNYLSAADGQLIPNRLFRLPSLDVLQRQDGEASLYLTRNEEPLGDGRRAAAPFIYTTPTVRFPSPLLPTLSSDEPINIAIIQSPPSCEVVKRSLAEHLQALYTALFANAEVADNTLQLVVHYEHRINPQLAGIRVPVAMMPPVLTAVRTGGKGRPLQEVLDEQVVAIQSWFAAQRPPSSEGRRLLLDLTIMSSLTPQPMPILHLGALFLLIDDITPTPGGASS